MEQNSVNPESGQGETPRRRFLIWLLAILAAINGLIAGIPFLRSLAGTSSSAQKNQWSKVVEISCLPEGKPVDIRFMSQPEEAYLHTSVLHSVWVVKYSAGDITAFSPICPHLGCYYQWNQQSGRFECPCHASLFAPDGKVLGGPAPRSLDTLQTMIKDGNLFVKWERFKVGVTGKIPIA